MSAPNPVIAAMGRPFRLGIAGGAPPSMIGPVHRMAAAMDGCFALVAGVLSSRPERARAEGRAIGLPDERCYASVEAMIAAERARPDGIEALAIVTPNDSHARYARLALAAGLDLMLEKPLCNDLSDAVELARLAGSSGRAVALAHTYAGYPMLREMRARIAAGAIGAVRLVQIDYLAGGLATLVEGGADATKRWRLDPERSGPSLVLGDIGTHAHHLVTFLTGRPVESVSAEVCTLLPGRRVHDLAQVRVRLAGGARGSLDICNAAAGASNEVTVRVFGETGHLLWRHGDHARLAAADLAGDVTVSGAGQPNLSPECRASVRLDRPGHPEGLTEAVSNLYAGLAEQMLAGRGHGRRGLLADLTPGVSDGVDGLAFVQACLDSSNADGARIALARRG